MDRLKSRMFTLLLGGLLIALTASASVNPAVESDPDIDSDAVIQQLDEEVRQYLYVATPGLLDFLHIGGHGLLVYDIADNHRFVKRIPVAGRKRVDGTPSNVKGITASLKYNSIYISNLETMQRIDLETEQVVWEYQYAGGADQMALHPEGDIIYLPSLMREHWHVVDAESGDLITQIFPQSIGAHNTIFAPDGSEVYMAGLYSPILSVADAERHRVIREIGPFGDNIRPFTITSDLSLVYVNVNGLVGFEIGDLQTGEVLHRIDATDEGFPEVAHGEPRYHNVPSHGIGMTPDETEIWVVDAVNQYLHIYDNTVMPPVYDASIELRDEPYWITFGIDGTYAYPSTGEIVDVANREVIGQLVDENGDEVVSEKMVEVHLSPEGKAVRVGDRFAFGRVNEQ